MDRRDFIKLTAITGTSATLASCGNPEHQLIRFVPDEDLVPGVAEWKPSVCPMCAARLRRQRARDGSRRRDDPQRSGRRRRRWAWRRSSRATRRIRSARAACARAARQRSRSRITPIADAADEANGARGSGDFKEVAGTRRSRSSSRSSTRSPPPAIRSRWRSSPRPHGAAAARRWPPNSSTVRRAGADRLRAVRSTSAAAGQRDQLRPRAAADDRSRAVALRDQLRRRFPRHWNSPVAQSAGYGAMRQGRPGCAASSCRSSRGCR